MRSLASTTASDQERGPSLVVTGNNLGKRGDFPEEPGVPFPTAAAVCSCCCTRRGFGCLYLSSDLGVSFRQLYNSFDQNS